jgi:ABC-type uncharacterized transport system ATPase subunit
MSAPDPSSSVGLSVGDLSLAIRGLKALTNLPLSVAPISIAAAIGPNGAG